MLKLHCTICNKFIMDVDSSAASRLTGKEMCNACKERVAAIYKELGDQHEKYQIELQKKYETVKGEQAALIKRITQDQQSIRVIVGNIKGELENIIRNMLEERMTKVKPKKEKE